MGYPNYGNLLMQASCRRNFILEVVLTNAFGEPAKDKEVHFFFTYFKSNHTDLFVCIVFLQTLYIFQVVASLVYADDGTVVAKSRDDSEPPLLITCEGLEYAAISRPLQIIRGRALFKLKISQVSFSICKPSLLCIQLQFASDTKRNYLSLSVCLSDVEHKLFVFHVLLLEAYFF